MQMSLTYQLILISKISFFLSLQRLGDGQNSISMTNIEGDIIIINYHIYLRKKIDVDKLYL